MEQLEARKILQENKVLVDPEDSRSASEIVIALGLNGVETHPLDEKPHESAIME